MKIEDIKEWPIAKLVDAHNNNQDFYPFNTIDFNRIEQELIYRLEQGEKAITRYELVRKLSPRAFADICKLNISTGKPFDEIVDDLIPFTKGGAE